METRTKHLLCVEDHHDTCELITNILREFKVVSTTNKKDALEQARSQKFELIVIDYYLPDGTGDDLCREIREFDQKTPIVFVTASDDLTENQSRLAGGQGLVKKSGDFLPKLRTFASELA